MSGGSLDYVYQRVERAADEIARRAEGEFVDQSTAHLHRRFASHLRLVAKALHDVEWVHCCDMGDGDDHAAILRVLKRP